MTLSLANINWLAVVVAGVATFFLGAVWYMALFGNLWKKLNGYTEEQVQRMQKLRPPAVFFGGMILSYLLLSLVIAILVSSLPIIGASGGAMFGFLLWLGVAVPIGVTAWIASDKHFGVYAIDLSYQLVFLVMTGVIIAAWR